MKQYFAKLPANELVNQLQEKTRKFNRELIQNGWAEKWSKSNDMYFGRHMGERSVGASSLSTAGDQGELTTFGVNHYRNLIKHVLSMTTSAKPSFDPKARNSDTKSLQQTRLAGNIIDAYMVDKSIGEALKSAAERSLVFAKGFLFINWDKYQGKPYTSEKGPDGNIKIIREGDITVKPKSPKDIIYETKKKSWKENQWVIVRDFENRFDLAARKPELADSILGLTSKDELDELAIHFDKMANVGDGTDDEIPIYKFYHLATDALPQGRYMSFLNGGLVYEDGPAQSRAYREKLPVKRITPGEVFDTAEGYTESFDILLLQQVMNVLYNIPFNNQQAFGLQVIWMPDGCEISASQLGKGLSVLKGGPPGSQPIPLQLNNTPKEIFTNIEQTQAVMEKLLGLNSVVTGDPDHNLKSGVALGRMQAMAIQYNSNYQQSWAELNQDSMTFVLMLLQDNANTPRMSSLAGKSNRGAMFSFTGKDIDQIESVTVDLGNPLSRTVSGRIDLADKLYDKGEIDGKQYIQVVETGQVESILESKESELELIKTENELLMDGKPVRAIVGDAHLNHAREHKAVMNDPHLREMAAKGDQGALSIVQATTNHINEHMQLYETQLPFWSTISGEPPPPMPPPPTQGQPGPGGLPPEQQGPPPPLTPEQGGQSQPPPVPPV